MVSLHTVNIWQHRKWNTSCIWAVSAFGGKDEILSMEDRSADVELKFEEFILYEKLTHKTDVDVSWIYTWMLLDWFQLWIQGPLGA